MYHPRNRNVRSFSSWQSAAPGPNGGPSIDEMNQESLKYAAAFSAANKNTILVPVTGKQLDYRAAVQTQGGIIGAQNNLTNSLAQQAVSTGQYYQGQGQLALAQGRLADMNSTLVHEQAVSQAADTYKNVQGGEIAKTSLDALPYLLGGVVVLGLVAVILYAGKKRK